MNHELNTLKKLAAIFINNTHNQDTLRLLILESERLPNAVTANICDLQSDYLVHQYIC